MSNTWTSITTRALIYQCPFCASHSVCGRSSDLDGFQVKCLNMDCGIRGPEFTDPEEAAKAWNTRPIINGRPLIAVEDDQWILFESTRGDYVRDATGHIARMDASFASPFKEPIKPRRVRVLIIEHPEDRVDSQLMVDLVPPATSRDRWMFEQGRMAERDDRSHKPAIPGIRSLNDEQVDLLGRGLHDDHYLKHLHGVGFTAHMSEKTGRVYYELTANQLDKVIDDCVQEALAKHRKSEQRRIDASDSKAN